MIEAHIAITKKRSQSKQIWFKQYFIAVNIYISFTYKTIRQQLTTIILATKKKKKKRVWKSMIIFNLTGQ